MALYENLEGLLRRLKGQEEETFDYEKLYKWTKKQLGFILENNSDEAEDDYDFSDDYHSHLDEPEDSTDDFEGFGADLDD
jgi:hypothetical protein